jgi:hypothetical protein
MTDKQTAKYIMLGDINSNSNININFCFCPSHKDTRKGGTEEPTTQDRMVVNNHHT